MFNRRNLLQTSALARVVPAWAQGTESPLPKLGRKLQLPDVKLLNGEVWTPENRPPARLWCTGGRAGALFVRCSLCKRRVGTVVFAEGGEMFPEDIEGLKKYI